RIDRRGREGAEGGIRLPAAEGPLGGVGGGRTRVRALPRERPGARAGVRLRARPLAVGGGRRAPRSGEPARSGRCRSRRPAGADASGRGGLLPLLQGADGRGSGGGRVVANDAPGDLPPAGSDLVPIGPVQPGPGGGRTGLLDRRGDLVPER